MNQISAQPTRSISEAINSKNTPKILGNFVRTAGDENSCTTATIKTNLFQNKHIISNNV